jgi:hypothetical protein
MDIPEPGEVAFVNIGEGRCGLAVEPARLDGDWRLFFPCLVFKGKEVLLGQHSADDGLDLLGV